MRRVVAAVSLDAIQENVAVLKAAAPTALLCAVVKADGYGHGAVASARAAQAGGARWLAVATADEAVQLRAGGIEGRLLVLGALTRSELARAVDARADVVVWTEAMVAGLAGRFDPPVRVHVKYDTGMGRLGTRSPDEALRTVQAAIDAEGVELAGVMTHFATADDESDRFFDEQQDRFAQWVREVRLLAPDVLAHAANSAALLRDPASHFDMVRPGVAIYGLDPFGRAPADHNLQPAMELRSYVAEVKTAEVGDSVGYGRAFVATAPTTVATVPLGYGDGWLRAATEAGVLHRARRRDIIGRISMDNTTIALGATDEVEIGDPVVFLGGFGDERILAEEVAAHVGTINYEITCGLTARVPRSYGDDREDDDE